jgi:Na+/melibiose symporter-like transporter
MTDGAMRNPQQRARLNGWIAIAAIVAAITFLGTTIVWWRRDSLLGAALSLLGLIANVAIAATSLRLRKRDLDEP